MTNRLARSILLIVWATLIAGEIVAYMATRQILLADLDASLVAHARSVPELSGTVESAPRLEEAVGARYVVENRLHQTLGRLAADHDVAPMPKVLSARLTTLGDGSHERTLILQFTPKSGGAPIQVPYSESAERVDRVLDRLSLALSLFAIGAGIAAAGVAVVVSRTALRPLRNTAAVIGEIDQSHLDRRIDVSALPEEMHPVADRLNEMLTRLEQAFAQRKRFLADASHELRTPVAALVTTLEVALRRPRDASDLVKTLRTCLSDARMLRQLVQSLMEHARAESSALDEVNEEFDAADVVHQCLDVADGLAAERDVTVLRTVPVALDIRGKRLPLRGIMMNLLGNAIAYNRPGGTIELRAEVNGTDLKISVADTGRGIAAEDLPHIFEPFYRAQAPCQNIDSAEEHHHMGLGLALVASHIKSLGGSCNVQSKVGVGTTVTVHLPGVVLSQPVILEGAAT